MCSTPCSLRLFASKSAPLISAISSLLPSDNAFGGPDGGGRRPVGDAQSAQVIEECLARQLTHFFWAGKCALRLPDRRFRAGSAYSGAPAKRRRNQR